MNYVTQVLVEMNSFINVKHTTKIGTLAKSLNMLQTLIVTLDRKSLTLTSDPIPVPRTLNPNPRSETLFLFASA